MSIERDQQIGYNRQVRLEWLDYTASLVASGNSPKDIKVSLDRYLQDQLSVGSNAVRGSRGKTISILLSIWVTVPKHLIDLRDEAIDLLKRLSASEHLALHWGMTMTAYPFFGVVAETTGRMLGLQGSVATAMLKNRMREIYGQRETAVRSTRYAIYSFNEWGILTETKEAGVYRTSTFKSIQDHQLQEWMLKALLLSEGKNLAPLYTLIHSPKLFPFRFDEPLSLSHTNNLEFFRQGLDEEMVLMRKAVL